jgi:hypothetical protein
MKQFTSVALLAPVLTPLPKMVDSGGPPSAIAVASQAARPGAL